MYSRNRIFIIQKNPRFVNYCPYCQIATSPSNPLPQGLREPPSYDFATSTANNTVKVTYLEAAGIPPPPYPSATTPIGNSNNNNEKSKEQEGQTIPQDTLHFLHSANDTVASLSLRYNVPSHVLRRYNNLTSDHLLPARKTILIPGSHYPSGVSLSPNPVGGEEEDERKAKIRRWMVACKCADYDVAELYLEQARYDPRIAMERYLADEEWEREHPLESIGGKGKTKTKAGSGGTWASQAAFLRRRGPS